MLQTLHENDNIKDTEEGNRLGKINFADLLNDTMSLAGFSLSRQLRVGQNDVTKHDLL